MRNISQAEEVARRLLDLMSVLGRSFPIRDPLARAMEDMEEMGLTPAQFHALMWLGKDGPLTMGELARRLGITEKTVTGLVDRIERPGFACRCRQENDRRVVEVGLTEAGMKLWRTLDRHVHERTTMMLSVLGSDDLDALVRIARNLVEGLVEAGRKQ